MQVEKNQTEIKTQGTNEIMTYIMADIESKNTNNSTKVIVENLENLMKNLQKYQFKPERRNELVTDQNILSFLDLHADNNKNLVKTLQRKINELKANSNANFNFSKNSSFFSLSNTGLIENPQTNYFIIENLSDGEDFSRQSLIYLFVICPSLKEIDFFVFNDEIHLSFQNINSLVSTNCKSAVLEQIFNVQLENYLEQKVEKEYSEVIVTDILNMSKLLNDLILKKDNEISLNFGREILLLTDYTLNKFEVFNRDYEPLKKVFLDKNYHRNFMNTNNMKFMKNFLESEIEYFCSTNQLSQMLVN